MKRQSRKEFIKNSFYLLFSGLSLACFSRLSESEENPSANNSLFVPSYLKLHKTGELKKRGKVLWNSMSACTLCPRMCKINRLEGYEGFCHADVQLEISSYHPHFGEEKPLVGKGGSGTIFFANCNLRCVFCINWEISLEGQGTVTGIENMARMMLHLQKIGCHNINFVTPTHYLPHIILALDKAASLGLSIPLVYNTCGWERLEILKQLDGIIDIYLPDFKYFVNNMSAKYSANAYTYPDVTKKALLEMYRQVGTAKPSSDGLVYNGLMLRHLVMPNNVGGTLDVLDWIAENLPKDTYLNLMSQYQPVYKAKEYAEISRGITRNEYTVAVDKVRKLGLTQVEIQGYP